MHTSSDMENFADLVNEPNLTQKIDRSLGLFREAHEDYGDRMVAANRLGKDSAAVWHLAKRIGPNIAGFIITTCFKPAETAAFMHTEVARYPELRVFRSDEPTLKNLDETDPQRCSRYERRGPQDPKFRVLKTRL